MLSQDVETDIYATAMALADEARRVILPLFRGDALSTENKLADGFDPVTVADRGALFLGQSLTRGCDDMKYGGWRGTFVALVTKAESRVIRCSGG